MKNYPCKKGTEVFMFRVKFFSVMASLLCFSLVLLFVSCATAPARPSPTVPVGPDWTRGGTHERFHDFLYLTAVGSGSSRHAAEMNAFGQLVAIFGMDIQVDERLRESYREVMRSGAAATWTHDTAIDRDVAIQAGMDGLIGAEIGDVWETRRSSYALAVMNRARAVQIYSEMIRANQEIIDNLTNMPAEERNSLDGFSRYQFAAVLADMNISYGAVLSVIGSPQYAQGLRRGDDFRRGAQEIATAIPISISVSNDRAGRIQSAFAAAFSDLGFRTGGVNPRYVLDVDIVLLPTEHQGPNVFARMELTANLVETGTAAVLLPYTFNRREGHVVLSEAENRVFLYAERRISNDYRDMLSNYLSQLIPRQ